MIWLVAGSLVAVVLIVVLWSWLDWRLAVREGQVERERRRRWHEDLEDLQRKAYVANGRKPPPEFQHLAGPEQRGLPIVEAFRAAWAEYDRRKR